MAKETGALAPLWFIVGGEPLLAIEAQDSIRAKAMAAGYTERHAFVYDGAYPDYQPLYECLSSSSLFGEKQLIEITIPRGMIGQKGPAAIAALVEACDDSRIAVVSVLDYDWKTEAKEWFKLLSRKGKIVRADPISRQALPGWIQKRAAALNQNYTEEAIAFIAGNTEGNLLACEQEIRKIALLCPAGEVTLQDVIGAISDVSRFDPEDLSLAILEGNGERVCRILDGLKAENIQIPAFLWMISEDVRTLIELAGGRGGTIRASATKRNALNKTAKRVNTRRLALMLSRLARVDKLAKGLPVPMSTEDAWQELRAACLMLSV